MAERPGVDENGATRRFRGAATRSLTIGVVGLGYAGLPMALGFAHRGFTVVGIDTDRERLRALAAGVSYVEGIDDAAVRDARLSLSGDHDALQRADVIVVCVPTSLGADDLPDLRAFDEAVARIAPLARDGRLVINQSTVPPGATRGIAAEVRRRTGQVAGVDYHLVHAPERVNPGDPAWRLSNTPRLVGGLTGACAAYGRAVLDEVCDRVEIVDSLEVAECAKLFENSFRLVNLALVNEFAAACRRLGVPPHEAIAAAATKPYGFLAHRPGPGVGGDCIPVDPVFLADAARRGGRPISLVESARDLVAARPAEVVADVEAELGGLDGRSVLVLGVTYKAGVADVRHSPAVRILDLLCERRANVAYCDPLVPRLPVGGVMRAARPYDAEELARYDCAVLATDHREFVEGSAWRSAPLVFDTRGCLPADLVRRV